MKRLLLVLVVLAAVLTPVAPAAQGGKATLCNQPTSQTETGGIFVGGFYECMATEHVFAPTVTISDYTVDVGQTITVRGAGFHKSMDMRLVVLQFDPYTGPQLPPAVPAGHTDSKGNFTYSTSFSHCGANQQIVLWFRDAMGVGAGDTVTLCP